MNPRIRLMPPQGIAEINEPRSSSYNLEIQNVRTNDAGKKCDLKFKIYYLSS